MPDRSLLELARAVAADADEAAGEEVEAYVANSRETSVRAFAGDVEQLASAESAGIGVRVVRSGRVGFAWVASLGESSAREALAAARDNVTYASVDEHAGLARPDGLPAAELDLWRDQLAATPADEKVALVLELERAVRAADRRIRQVVHADYSDGLTESAVATSTGIFASSRRTICHLFVYAIAGEGDETQTGFGYSAGRSLPELDLDRCARDAVDRATRMLGATKPRSAQLPVVLDRRVSATLLGILAGTLSGEEVAKGRSLFANRVGEQVAHGGLTLVDDPTAPEALGATPFDAEGLATRRNVLIERGRLTGYLYDTHSARAAGTQSTGAAVRGGYWTTPGVGARAISLQPGELSQEQILSDVGDGLFVQSISGVHSGVNRVSGDFSVGAEGLMIRDGALAEPVREMTIASTLQRMLQHVRHVGADLEWLPGQAAGMTLAIDDVSLGGA
ncbi:MAG TPA: TldD/PmbA family protein [Acidimicrobiales bacterium]|nr:TldD/PmbA family protein [Acidimicrobiales bacterium]